MSFISKLITFIKRSPLSFKIIVGVLVGIGGYVLVTHSQKPAPTYQTATVEKGTLVDSVAASGQVSSTNTAPVITHAGGVVKKVSVTNGQVVKSGAPIMELDLDQGSKQKYDQTLSSYQSAKNTLDAAKKNLYTLQSKMFAANQKFVNDALSRGLSDGDPTYIQENADWLAAEADYKNQQQVINQAQTSVTSTWLALQQASPTVYAPIAGTVTGLSLQDGSVLTTTNDSAGISNSQKIANIQTDATPTITVNLTEADVSKVHLGDKVSITVDALKDKTFTGLVHSIDTAGAVSSSVTTYPTVITLDTQVTDLYANMSVQANIITQTKSDVLLVPASAVQTQTGNTSVRVLKNGQVTSVPVEVGLRTASQVEITSGLVEGDVVVTSISSTGTTARTSQAQSPFSALTGGRGGFVGGGGGGARLGR